MKLCTVCGVVSSRAGSRCTEHTRQSNRSRHNALYGTRAWQRLSARVLRAWHGEHGNWCLGESLQVPEKSKEKADLMHAIYDRITVAGPEIVGVRLTQAAYAHGLALALPEKVVMARPTGVGRAISTYTIPIEGRDEWLAAARRLA